VIPVAPFPRAIRGHGPGMTAPDERLPTAGTGEPTGEPTGEVSHYLDLVGDPQTDERWVC